MNYPYETLQYTARLKFRDAFGLEADYHAYQRIRVLAPEIFSVALRAWGDGDPVHDFYSPAAAAVHLVTDSDPLAVVLVLKRPAKRGEEIEIHSVRWLHHSFKLSRPHWEYVPFSPTERAQVAIDFPLAREPEAISVSNSVGARSPYVKRPGTKELTLRVSDPIPGSLYRAEWSW